MTVDDQLYDVRFAVNDFPDVIYSIYEKINVMNQVLQMMNTILANISSDLVKSRDVLYFANGEADLPSNYGGMISLVNSTGLKLYERIGEPTSDLNTYEVLGGKIYASHDTLTLTYKNTFTEFTVDDLASVIPVPDMFKPVITSYCKSLLTQAQSFDTRLIAQLEADVKRRTSSRTNKAFRYAWTC